MQTKLVRKDSDQLAEITVKAVLAVSEKDTDRYNVDIDERQHGPDHISDLVELYLEQLQKIVTITEEEFPVFILEKPNVNTLEDLTKDGKAIGVLFVDDIDEDDDIIDTLEMYALSKKPIGNKT